MPDEPGSEPAGNAKFTNKGIAKTPARIGIVQGTTLPQVEGVPIEPETLPPEPMTGPTGKPMVAGAPIPEDSWLPAEAVAFEHACCKAVRANPEDPDHPELTGRPEPYLTWEGSMRPTHVFGAFLSVAGILGVATTGLMMLEWIPMVLGVVLLSVCAAILLFLLVSVILFKGALRGLEVVATRHVLDERLERGRLFHARLDTAGTRVPASLKVAITDQLSPGLRPVEEPTVDGQGRIHYKVRPQGRGLLTFAGLDVKVRGAMGLWTQEREYRLRTTVEVLPSIVAGSWRAILSGYVPFGLGAPKSLVKLYREVEHEEVRNFGLGDRPKDIDWKYFARTGGEKLMIRRRSVDPESSILLVFDCGESMILDQAGYRNLDLAIEVGMEFMTYGLRRNHEVGLVAFNETQVLDHVKPTRKKIQAREMEKHLRNLANYHLPEEGEKPIEIRITGDPENMRMGMKEAFRQRNTAMLTLLFFTDLQTTPEEVVQTISKAVQSGMGACVFLMPPPKLVPVKPFADKAQQAEEERRSVEHTNRMRELLLGNGVDFQEIHPEDSELSLEKDLPPEVLEELGMMPTGTPPPAAPVAASPYGGYKPPG